MPKSVLVVAALVFAIHVSASAQHVAAVNGKPITQTKADLKVAQALAEGAPADTPQLRESIKLTLIATEVLRQEADKQGFARRPDILARLNQIAQRISTNILAETIKNHPTKETDVRADFQRIKADMAGSASPLAPSDVDDRFAMRTKIQFALDNATELIIVNAMLGEYVRQNPVTDAEIQAEYVRMKTRKGDTEYQVRHILVPSESDATALLASIRGGAQFSDLARAHSKDASATKGGQLGWTSPVSFVAEFAQALVALGKGEITPHPVRTQYGYHLIQLEDIRPAMIPTLEETKAPIVEVLELRKLRDFREALVRRATIG
ncbi:peptidylprolyl isomerase [Massilia sp. CCM 8734]|uniref:peptidylprolyl isomerase n=1 Tax=Massilia sp. CCM 8734 TaxID=2609283 RepID=UPI00141F81D0|nr:peptidylprolyl isomerase [Massilia sp. CCM 8734]NHZ98469.1 peptidylprolyl isomerase [Massilia sp. CCM 8734]